MGLFIILSTTSSLVCERPIFEKAYSFPIEEVGTWSIKRMIPMNTPKQLFPVVQWTKLGVGDEGDKNA